MCLMETYGHRAMCVLVIHTGHRAMCVSWRHTDIGLCVSDSGDTRDMGLCVSL